MGAVVLLGGAVAACQVLAGIEDRAGAEDAGGDAGVVLDASDAAVVVDAAPDPACVGTSLPPATDAGADDPTDITITVATKTVAFRNDAGVAYGTNLDGICTCCTGCPVTAPSCASGQVSCDQAGGVDSNIGSTFGLLSAFDPYLDVTNANSQIAHGYTGVGLQIRHWNGKAEDPTIEISLIGLPVLLPETDAGNPIGTPKFDGTDTWGVSKNSISASRPDGGVPSDYPLYRSTDAWFTGGRFYVNLPSVLLPVGNLSLTLSIAQISGTPTPNPNGGYDVLDARMVGRVPTANMLQLIAVNLYNNKPICNDPTIYSYFKGQVCKFADLAADPSLDDTMGDAGVMSSCNAISFGGGFVMVSSHFGEAVDDQVAPLGNCPAFSDDCP